MRVMSGLEKHGIFMIKQSSAMTLISATDNYSYFKMCYEYYETLKRSPFLYPNSDGFEEG